MTENEEVYLSIARGNYRTAKTNLLSGQKSLLQSMKHIHNLTVLSRKKNDLKVQIKNYLQTIYNNIKIIQENSPKPNIPKKLQKNIEVRIEKVKQELKEDPTLSQKEAMEKKKRIEMELKTIQDKLKNLNG